MISKKLLLGASLIALAGAAGVYGPAFLGLDGASRLARAALDEKHGAHGTGHEHGAAHSGAEEPGHGEEGVIKLSEAQITAANIALAPAENGVLTRQIFGSGTIIVDPDRVARVAAKVSGTVAELRKRLGDSVAQDEVIAVLESREVADAKGDYLSALVTYELQKTLVEREQALWDKRISAEQQFIKARSIFTEAWVKVELARQKLLALDVHKNEIDVVLPEQAAATASQRDVVQMPKSSDLILRRHELRAPISGQVIERKVDRGAPVGQDNQETEIFVLADLSTVAVELGIPVADLDAIKAGQRVLIKGSDANHGDAGGKQGEGKIIFVNPMVDKETRSARVLVALENKDLVWHPGTFVSAYIIVAEDPVEVSVPSDALQKIQNETVVFVRNGEGFEKRDVVVGKTDGRRSEIIFGLDPGERVASSNVFTLKADLGKSEAEHSH